MAEVRDHLECTRGLQLPPAAPPPGGQAGQIPKQLAKQCSGWHPQPAQRKQLCITMSVAVGSPLTCAARHDHFRLSLEGPRG